MQHRSYIEKGDKIMGKFRLIKSNLYEGKSDIMSRLWFGNDDYVVRFNYFGNYAEDRDKNKIDMGYLSLVIEPRPGCKGMPMKYVQSEDEIFISIMDYHRSLLDDAATDELIQCLQNTKEIKESIHTYIHMFANGEFIDVDKEFDPPVQGFYTVPDLPDRYKKFIE